MKDKILECAKHLFKEHGIKKVTVDDIAHKLSISKKTIYEHFTNKEEIADAVLEKIIFENHEKIEMIKNDIPDPLDQIQQILEEISGIMENINPVFIPEVKNLLHHSYPKFLDYLNSYFFTSISEIFEKGIETGVFRKDINPEVMARHGFEVLRSAIRTHGYNTRILSNSGFYSFFILGIVTEKGRSRIEGNQVN